MESDATNTKFNYTLYTIKYEDTKSINDKNKSTLMIDEIIGPTDKENEVKKHLYNNCGMPIYKNVELYKET